MPAVVEALASLRELRTKQAMLDKEWQQVASTLNTTHHASLSRQLPMPAEVRAAQRKQPLLREQLLDLADELFAAERAYQQAVEEAPKHLRQGRNERLLELNRPMKEILDQAVVLAHEAKVWEDESVRLGLKSEPWPLWHMAPDLIPSIEGGTTPYAERIKLLKDRGL